MADDTRIRLDVLPNQGECVAVPIGNDERGLPVEALVARAADGSLRAYTNVCQHVPIPLDSGSGEFLSEDGEHFICLTHGALYRIEDGVCVAGPCRGRALDRVPLDQQAGDEVYLVPPAVPNE